MRSTFLPYEEPTTIQLLILGSFLLFLPISQRVFQRVLSAGILGPLAVGVIYGVPLANILPHVWQEAYLVLGYLGLILIVFEGGLSTRLDLLRDNLPLSLTCALTGICCPIALSFAILTPGYQYPLVESFILGAALSATSLGTTFAILGSLGGTRVGTIAMSAAMIDDVVGLIMASIVTSLNPASTSNNLGWSIGRPIMAAGLLTIFVPLLLKFAICPLYIRFLAPRIISRSSPLPMAILVLTLAALCTGAAYAGTSILYGAYLAGVVLTYLDAHTGRTTDPGVAPAPNQGHTTNGDITTYASIFHTTIGPLQSGFLEPLFFASIGFAIPFRSAWQGTVIWRGVVYTLLMLIGKAVVGGWLPIWTHGPRIYRSAVQRIHQVLRSSPSSSEMSTARKSPSKGLQHPERRSCTSTAPALLLGCMMVARGEIGLLILQLGYIQSGHVSDQGFLVGTWAVVLNTLIGPIAVGMITRRYGEAIIQGEWGDVDPQAETGARRVA